MNVRLLFFFQAEDGIRYLVRSRGLGDVYKRQVQPCDRASRPAAPRGSPASQPAGGLELLEGVIALHQPWLLQRATQPNDAGGHPSRNRPDRKRDMSGLRPAPRDRMSR